MMKEKNIKSISHFFGKKRHNSKLFKIFLAVELLIVVVFCIFIGKWFLRIETGKIEVEKERFTAASYNHSAWIRDGKLYIAGEPYSNQKEIENWENLIQVSISDHHIVALDQTGRAYATGTNASLQCEISGLKKVSYIEAGMNCSIAVMKNGTLKLFGIIEPSWRQSLEEEKNVQMAAIGDNHIVVLHNDGTVSAYGDNILGQCNVEKWKNIIQVDVGYDFTVGLGENGHVYFTGNDSFEKDFYKKWSNISSITAGNNHVLAIDKEGTVYASGMNMKGECDVTNWKSMRSVAGGFDHTIGIGNSGHFWAIGFNGSGQCDVSAF